VPCIQDIDELCDLYQLYHTPATPPGRSDIRFAVAIDCEMGTAMSGDSELIRVTMIDYFSGAILVDNIVEPDVPMRHLNTRFSGVSWADVKMARRKRTCLQGKAGARRAIWKYVGPATFVIGHSVSNDLRALRWLHALVVDSFVTEFVRVKRKEGKEAEEAKKAMTALADLNGSDAAVENLKRTQPLNTECQGIGLPKDEQKDTAQKTARIRKTPGKFCLKTLAKKHLDRDIQMNGNQGHDSLEDAIASRDLVHWTVLHPEV
jgi:RNA exonuclease 1